MQLSIKHYLFLFFLFPLTSVSAQWHEPFLPNFPSENSFFEESNNPGKDLFSQDLFSGINNNWSNNLYTNIFSYTNWGYPLFDTNATEEHPRGETPIAGVPVNSGLFVFLFLSLFYAVSFFDKKKQLFVALLLSCFFATDLQAQVPFTAKTDNFFVQPNSSGNVLDVLRNDELGTCDTISVTLNLPSTSSAKNGTLIKLSNKIIYIPDTGFVGRDQFSYSLTCQGASTPAVVVYINVSDKPDNIEEDVCYIEPKPISFEMKELSRTDNTINPVSPIICGDIDDDGEVEILVYNSMSSTDRRSNAIKIYGVKKTDSQLYLKYTIDLPVPVNSPFGGISIANVDGGRYAAIFVTTPTELRKYVFNDGVIPKKYDLSWSRTIMSGYYPTPVIADFMGNGNVQVQVLNQIYNAKTGTLLVNGITNVIGGAINYGTYGHTSPAPNQFASTFVSADIDNDGIPELIAGDCVYKVIINNPNSTSGNSFVLVRRADRTNHPEINETGGTAVADMDGNGELDVIVAAKGANKDVNSLYIYNPRDGKVLHTNSIANLKSELNQYSLSLPFVGDLDGDGQPEVAVNSALLLNVFKFDKVSKLLNLYKDLETTDGSGATTLTLFDFEQSGRAQLVYRDEDTLRILDEALNNLSVITSIYSPTVNEYPIVADVNGDGAAEIIAVGTDQKRLGDNTWNWAGSLRIYGAAGTDTWAPARSVWDRFGYNPTNINDDLTIPRYPMNPATEFIDKDGNKRYPFNNFLQQATMLNEEGKMFRYGPDLAFDTSVSGTNSTGITYTNSGVDDIVVVAHVTNLGDADFPSPLRISAYIMEGGLFVKVFSSEFAIPIGMGDTEPISFTITNIRSRLSAAADESIQLRLNEEDGDLLVDECKYSNNFSNGLLYGAPSVVACPGDQIRLNFYPKGSGLSYVWYDEGNYLISTNDYANITKNTNEIQRYFVEVFANGSSLNNGNLYEVNAYLTPDSLIWTGNGGTSNWHNYLNWHNPDPTSIYPRSWIPRSCTNVLIPDGLSVYPILDTDNTNRSVYWDAACNNIHFEFGGEVARTDSLHYSKAFIQYNFGYYDASGNPLESGYSPNPSVMERDRWYAVSAPLNKIVTGDFSLGGKPHTWQKEFISLEKTSGAWVGNWYSPDNTNNIELDQARSYAIALLAAGNNPHIGESLSDGYQVGLNGLNGIIDIPYFENPTMSNWHRIHTYNSATKTSSFKYYYYDQANLPLAGDHPEGTIIRGDEAYRFIFDKKVEKVNNKASFKITVPTGVDVMIGNPFMSSLDFDKLYEADINSSKIENFYRLFEETSWAEYTYGDGSDPIAVLQAFFIKTKGAPGGTVDLVFPFEDVSITRPSTFPHQLKSSGNTIEDMIQITAKNKNRSNSIKLFLNREKEENNVHKLFYEQSAGSPQIYFTDESNQKNAIQYVNNQSKMEIPLGISLQSGNQVELEFSNLENTDVESAYLVDKKTGTRQNLLKNSVYSFIHADANDYSDRFLLEIETYNPTYIDRLESQQESIRISQEGENIVVSSIEKINRIELFDLQGQMIQQVSNVNNNTYQMNPNLSTGIYLIKTILMNNESQTDKIVIR